MLVHFLLDSRRPHKKGRREASAQEARSQIPEQEDSALGNNSQSPAGEWWWSPFFRVRKLISEPRHAAAGARLHVRIISQARKWSHGRAPAT